MNKEDFLKVENFKDKMATKIYNSIHEKIKESSLPEIAASSNIFERGFGKKKLDLIFSSIPKILDEIKNNINKNKNTNTNYLNYLNDLNNISGMANTTSSKFLQKLPYFIEFLIESKLVYKLDEYIKKINNNNDNNNNNNIEKIKVIMTGFRDKDLSKFLELHNFEIQTSINKNTKYLIVKSDNNKNDNSTKIDFAKANNIKIVTPNELKHIEKLK